MCHSMKLWQLQQRYREGRQDLHCSLIWKKRTTESRWKNCIGACEARGYHTSEWHVPSMRKCSEWCCRNKRTLCHWSWPPPMIRFQPFPVCHHNGFTDGKHQKRSTLADDVRRWCGSVRKGKRRAGVGTGAVEGSLGEGRNESIKSKHRVHVYMNGTPLGRCNVPSCHRSPKIQISGKHPACRAMVTWVQK